MKLTKFLNEDTDDVLGPVINYKIHTVQISGRPHCY
jgi:hypothetical protein